MATSYSNNGGSGDRRILVPVTADVGYAGTFLTIVNNGATNDAGAYFTGGAVSGKYIKWSFPVAVVIDEFKFYQTGGSYEHGTWKCQGSNNDADWTDIGTQFTFGSSSPDTITEVNGNTTAYNFYRFLGVSGNTNGAPWVYEFEAKIDIVSSSYLAPLGSGDRSATITASDSLATFNAAKLIEGDVGASGYTNFSGGEDVSGKYIKFDFGSSIIIGEAKWVQDAANCTHGSWKWQGSDDDSNWSDIGSSFTLGGPDTQTQTELNGNTTGYRYYRLLGISGTTNGSAYVYEIFFNIVEEEVAPPSKATTPDPEDDEIDVAIDKTLSWADGGGATSYDVYFGTSSPPDSIDNQAGTTYDPGELEFETEYFWRIDAVNDGGTTEGDEWSFTTAAASAASRKATTVTVIT